MLKNPQKKKKKKSGETIKTLLYASDSVPVLLLNVHPCKAIDIAFRAIYRPTTCPSKLNLAHTDEDAIANKSHRRKAPLVAVQVEALV